MSELVGQGAAPEIACSIAVSYRGDIGSFLELHLLIR
jgi:hypothetical protein